ncbi:MAG TPA: glycosyltransferase [Chitinophagaceae bacterium]
MMEFTGERYIPVENSKDEISVEHLHRYHSILPLVKGKVVLDIACGEGYGSALMARSAKKVIGVDISEECIVHAVTKYASQFPHTHFLQGSVEAIPVEDASVDVVISFETLEHVSAEGQERFLSEVKRVLKSDGVFVVSTPDKENYSNRYGHENHFHVHELGRADFKALLECRFGHVCFLEQGFDIVSSILPIDHAEVSTVRRVSWQEQGQTREGKYLLAVASDAPVSDAPLASVVWETDKSYFAQVDRIVELQQQVEDRSAWALRLDREREQNEAVIRTLKEQAQQKQVEQYRVEAEQQKNLIESQQEQIAGQQKQIITLQEQITNLCLENESYKEQLAGQQHKLLALQQALNESDAKNADLTAQASIVSGQLQEKERLFQDLQFNFSLTRQQLSDVNNKLVTIYDSDGWKVLDKYYLLKGKLLNERSTHYRLVKQTVNFLRNRKDSLTSVPAATPVKAVHSAPRQIPVRTLPLFLEPTVSIIIPVYNAWEMNEKCIASILEHTRDVAYEVIVADDCSTDETKDIARYFENVVHVRNEQNQGFLKNCNHAASFAKGKFIHFLNNDTEVKPAWLSSLVRLMERDATVGMAGSKLIYPDGTLQEAGGIIWNDASGWNFGNRQNPDLPQFNYVKEVDYLSGASLLVRKSLWDELGGFDECYTPAYCEDSDLAFAIRQKGYKVLYQPLSEVVHYEGYSHGSDSKASNISSIKEYQKLNNRKFYEKWKGVLQSEQFPNAENVFWAKDRSRHRKTLLMVDHYVPQFDKDAGSRTTFQYLELFVKLGYNVKFLGENFYRHEPYTTMLQQMGIEVLYGPWYRDNWQQWFRENSDKFDYIYLNRPHISINFIDFFRQHSRATILYYGHDLHFLREQMRYEVEKDKALLEQARKWKEIEMALFRKSDIVLTPSTEEQKVIQALDPSFNVQLMRPFMYKTASKPVDSFEQRKDLLFVGGFGHLPNIDGVLWFVREVWPMVKAALPSIKFLVAGSNPTPEIKALASDSVIIKGYVTDEELEHLYATCRIAVIPLRYGAGVKGKTVEAMHKGLPVVSTRYGIEGFPGHYEAFIGAYDSADAFARQVIALYDNPQALWKASEDAAAYINNYFTFEAAAEMMVDILKAGAPA